MNADEVKQILIRAENPLTCRFDIPPFDFSLPQLRFRGGESGKFYSSIRDGFYMGSWNNRVTYCAYSMFDAIGFSLLRTDSVDPEKRFDNDPNIGAVRRGKGGRYDPTSGKKIEGFRYGFPFLIAMDIRKYKKDFNYKIGDIEIREPISLEDVVVLFDKNLDLLSAIRNVAQSDFYEGLVQRRKLAFEETIVKDVNN